MTDESRIPTTFKGGVKFGLGFSIPFIILYGVVSLFCTYVQKSVIEDFRYDITEKTFGPDAGLEILSHKPRRTEHNVVVLGNVRNSGQDIWDRIGIQVYLFGKEDQLVATCQAFSFLIGPLHPGQERFFEVDCRGEKDDPTPSFSRYEIEIVDATYKPANDT